MNMGDNHKLGASRQDPFFDLKGQRSGIALTKKHVVCILLAVILPILCKNLPLEQYGENVGLSLGLLLMVMLLMFGGVANAAVVGALFCFLAVSLGLLDLTTLQNSVGNGMFFQIIGLCIVGYGIESTPFGNRMTFLLLRKFGTSPGAIIFILFFVSAVLSSMLSNFAVLVLVSNIANKILSEMGEKPGESRFGATIMLSVVAGSSVGGIGLINGSPGVNVYGLASIQAATGYTLSAAQWAMMGFPCVALLVPIGALIYGKCGSYDGTGLTSVTKGYYDEKLKELGTMGGSEWRWIILSLSMVVLMLLGFPTTPLMLIYIVFTCAPVIGVVKVEEAFGKAVPWIVVFSSATMVQIGTVISQNGLTELLSDFIVPYLSGMPPLLIMFLLAVLTGLLTNALVGMYAAMSITITCMAPVVYSLGYHPAIFLLPCIFMTNFMIANCNNKLDTPW